MPSTTYRITSPRRWSSNWEFLLSTLIYTVHQSHHYETSGISIGNNLEPVLAPICVLLICIPIQYMQIALGQFSQSSATKLRYLNPLAYGIAYSFMLVSFLRLGYETILAGDAFLYFLNTMQADLPWLDCTKCISSQQNNARKHCWEGDPGLCTVSPCLDSTIDMASSCYWNETFMQGIPHVPSATLPDFRRLITVVLIWVLVYSVIFATKKKLMKPFLRYIFVLSLCFRVIVVISLLMVSPKATGGFNQSLDATIHSIMDLQNWSRTLVAMVSFMSLGRGGIIVLGSYFSPSCPSGVMTLFSGVLSTLYYILIASLHFTTTDMITKYAGLSKSDVVILRNPQEETNFTLIPAGLGYTSLTQLWTMMHFLSIVFHSIAHVTLNIRVLEVSLEDDFVSFAKYRKYVLIGSLIGQIALCLIHAAKGLYIYTHIYLTCGLDIFEVIITLIFVIIVAWIYGVQKLSDDIDFIVGSQPTKCWKVIWLLSPVVITLGLAIYLSDSKHGDAPFVKWVLVILLQLFLISPVVVLGCGQMSKFIKKRNLVGLFQSAKEWGPQDKDELRLRRTFNPRKETKFWRRNDQCKHKCLLKNRVLERVIAEETSLYRKDKRVENQDQVEVDEKGARRIGINPMEDDCIL